ncbi:hypothetical protein JRA98_002240 [Escherichia coli O28ac]|uniref:Uncharacterized protein n=3 Tax=Escherichia coli TaxID=562 RepID=A0A3K3Y9X2_ECOLX|nr:hypothetical protein CJZ69_20935 [Escherichia coli ATCC 8739]EAA1048085.1 hypothetical protein [Escherichia coli]EEY7947870.1 hypothetical protein [Escherichia coli H30]EEZ9699791.1 hypothetical protein [Escherichia coli O1]EFO2094979.1 hypothetical protein [Escherichia coli O19]EFO2116371.1 hypothetical protein [Escherichia coli O3]EFY9879985.1 hypothetical protein [Shigella dysenteriae]EHD3368259.1 hypothetical protein [Escherichia coli O28ac]EHD3401614.1 hypothetical protein [Escheric
MRLIKRARWKGEYLPGTGNVKREPVSGKMYRLQRNKNSLESTSGNEKLPGENGFVSRYSRAILSTGDGSP